MSTPALVLKFGGTSLGTPARVRRAARRVAAHAARGRRVVVVASAMGHATDRIVRLLAAVAAGGRPDPREADRALATGEDLSAALLAAALASLGVPARSLRGGEAGIRAEGGFCGGRVAGVDPAALAAALGPAECHVVTDVPAVFDRDPNRDAGARPIGEMDHLALLLLAESGAQVMHPEAARLALAHGVPLRVYGHRAPLSGRGGTTVRSRPAADDLDRPLAARGAA